MSRIPNFDSIKLCLSICGYDGLISEVELDTLYRLYSSKNDLTRELFDEVVDNYFSSEESLAELLAAAHPVTDELEIARQAASSDGLDIRENIALQVCKNILLLKEE